MIKIIILLAFAILLADARLHHLEIRASWSLNWEKVTKIFHFDKFSYWYYDIERCSSIHSAQQFWFLPAWLAHSWDKRVRASTWNWEQNCRCWVFIDFSSYENFQNFHGHNYRSISLDCHLTKQFPMQWGKTPTYIKIDAFSKIETCLPTSLQYSSLWTLKKTK